MRNRHGNRFQNAERALCTGVQNQLKFSYEAVVKGAFTGAPLLKDKSRRSVRPDLQ